MSRLLLQSEIGKKLGSSKAQQSISRSSFALSDVNSVIDNIKNDHDFKRAKSELNLRQHVVDRGNVIGEPELPSHEVREKVRSQ